MAPGWVLALIGGIAPAPAQASVTLSWEAPPECPDSQSVRRRLDEYLADAAGPQTSVVAVAEVRGLPDGFALSLRIETGGLVEQRELTDPDCTGLAEVTALWVAIAVSPELADTVGPPPAEVPEIAEDPEVPPEPTEADPEPAVPSAEPAVPSAVPSPSLEDERSAPPSSPSESAASPDPQTETRPRLWAAFGGGLGLGLHPLAGELEAAVSLAWSLARLEVRGHYVTPRRVETTDRADAGARVTAWTVGARACVVPTLRPWLGLPLCAGAEAGQLLGAPFGLEGQQRRAPVLVAATGSVGLRVVVGPRVALWASPELMVGLVRPQLTVGGTPEPLFYADAVGARFGLGVDVRLW